MRFSILTGNHGSQNGLSDTVTFLKHALQDCGHDARIDIGPASGRVNILIENFPDGASVRQIERARKAGVPFVLIATERLSRGTFNPDVAPTDRFYGKSRYWAKRFRGFMAVAQFAEAIWVLDESMLEPYRAAVPDKPVLFLPHGWVSHFGRVRPCAESGQDIDFYSSGNLTPHRRAVFAELERRGHRVVWDDAAKVPDYIRYDHVSRAKVCLSLKLSPVSEVPSVSRLHFLVQNACTAAIEQCAQPSWLDRYVLHLPGASLVACCEEVLALPGRREIAARAAECFANDMPMTRLLPPILLASLEGVAAA